MALAIKLDSAFVVKIYCLGVGKGFCDWLCGSRFFFFGAVYARGNNSGIVVLYERGF